MYVANFFDNTISEFRIGTNGALRPIVAVPTGVEPSAVVVDSESRFVYVANYFDGNISAYSVASDGRLTSIPGSVSKTGIWPMSIAMDPGSNYMFVANVGNNNVSGFYIDPNGALTPVTGSPFDAGSGPSRLPWIVAPNMSTWPMKLATVSPPTASNRAAR
jgi:6-phosphogluconolactonase